MRFVERFTELFSCRIPGDRSDGSYGSGFLLGGGIILTASHVVAPPSWGPPPQQLDITARPIREVQPSTNWLNADLIWPEHHELGQGGPDIALLRLRDSEQQGVSTALPLVGLGPEDEEGARDYFLEVYAVGFPKFTALRGVNDLDERRDTHHISAITKPFSGLVSQMYEIDKIDYGRRKNGTPLDAVANWVGFSGAPLLLTNRRLIGVVVTAANDNRGWFDFRAIRLAPLLARDDFLKAIEGAATVTTASARAEAPPIDRLVCLLDRDNQEREFILAHKSCFSLNAASDPPSTKPMICLLPGAAEYRHAPEDMADRFTLKTLPELAWPPEATTFNWLDWPAAHLGVPNAVARLRDSLWNALCGNGDPPETPDKFRELWKDGSRPRLFRSDLTQLPLNSETAQVLAAWAAFLAQIGPPDWRPPVHLLLLGASWAETEAWRAHAVGAANVIIVPLTELDHCNPIDLTRWLKERLPIRVAPAHRPVLEQLEPKLTEEFPTKFYLRELKRRVGQLVRERFHV